jgi:cytochrome c oxidase assembly protein subunit 15
MSPAASASDTGPWPHRLAFAAALATVPLVLFGGSVTTLGAGLAVNGWLVAEGHFLLYFPVEKWFRDTSTFVEHTHRLFGVLVGLFALGCLLATWLREPRRPARVLAALALAGVCLQGTLGGLRVLERDSALAFVHGALAQAVFALLCANALFQAPGWRAARPGVLAQSRSLVGLARLSVLVVYAQVFLGAWYRHSLRPAPRDGAAHLLLAHALGALLVLFLLALLVQRAARAREGLTPAPRGFERLLRLLPRLLWLQVVLGGLAWAGGGASTIGPAEWLLSVAHVLGGGLLFSATTLLWMWCERLGAPRVARHAPAPAAPGWRRA